jgi:signal peptidase II
VKRFLNKNYLAFIAAAVIVLTADQAVKDWMIATQPPHVSVPVLGPVLHWYLTYNDSAAFSIGFGATWVFAIISAAAALALLWFASRMRTRGWALLAGVLLGGVVGNLIDRLVRAPGFGSGQVVDYIQVPFNFPIFNLADSAICIVAGIVVILTSRGKKIGGQ